MSKKRISLHRLYSSYNRRFFGNRLPKRTSIHYGELQGTELAAANWVGLERDIEISKRLCWSPTLVKSCLLHEMAHLALPKNIGHGPQFQKEMLRLAKKGAFKGVW